MKTALILSVLLFLAVSCNAQELVAVRMVHAIANGPVVDVYFNNTKAFSELEFGSVAQYLNMRAGFYDVRLVIVANGNVLFEIQDLTVEDEHNTIVAHGSMDREDRYPFALTKLFDDNDPSRTQARIRMYHASAGAPDIDVAVGGSLVFRDVDYTELTDYDNINEGVHEITIVNTATKQQLVTPIDIDFEDETIVNLYFAGSADETDRYTLIVAIDLETGDRDPIESTGSASILSYSLAIIAFAFILI